VSGSWCGDVNMFTLCHIVDVVALIYFVAGSWCGNINVCILCQVVNVVTLIYAFLISKYTIFTGIWDDPPSVIFSFQENTYAECV
jgi:hypothetical protein